MVADMTTARRIAVALLSTLFLASIPSQLTSAAGKAGRLDPSFGFRGVVLTDFNGGTYEAAYALAIQQDGKLVAAGFSTSSTTPDFGVARYMSNGHLDRRFGAGGTVVTAFGGSGNADVANAVAIDSNGKVVVAGYSDASGSTDFALARYNPDGTLDSTFNSTGKVLTDLSGSGGTDAVSAVAIDSNGKIVVAGYSNASGISYDFALARYNRDGTLDRSFNSTGKVLTDFSGSGSGDVAYALALQSDGKIVVAGLSQASGIPDDFALARYNPDGTLDSAFNSTGKVLTDFSESGSVDVARALAIQSDGKIVAAGYSHAGGISNDFALARYNPDGTLDGSFNSTGKILTDFSGSESQDEGSAVAIQSDGKIVAAGMLFVDEKNADFALARYNPDDGSLDSTFNSTGKVLTDAGGFDVAYALAIQSDGKIVAAGFSDVSGTSDFAIARYLP
jgi:uncharacterized delta-60 repeat protein